MSTIQTKFLGGVGNQLHQYAAVRAYAERLGATFECPDWLGRKLFGLADPYPSTQLPEVNDREIRDGQLDVCVTGYFQAQRWIRPLSRHKLKQWFQILPRWLTLCPKHPRPYIAAHLRRGDYVDHPLYCTVSKGSYLAACAAHDLDEKKIVWVSDEHPQRVGQLEAEGLGFLPDFATIMQADVILRANSTFGWWAATLSDTNEIYAPVVEDLVGEHDVIFAKGNYPRCAHTSRVGVPVEDLYLSEG